MEKSVQFEDLIKKVMANPELQQKCTEAIEAGKGEELLKELGYTFTLEELTCYIEDKNEDLSPAELEAVAGGRKESSKTLNKGMIGVVIAGMICGAVTRGKTN